MPATIICPTCDGRRYVERPSALYPGTTTREKCPECGAIGNVYDRTGSTNLSALLVEHGHDPKVLDLFAEHREDLAAWLREIDFLLSTRYRIALRQGRHDGWGHTGPSEFVPAEVTPETPVEDRFFRVKVAS